MPQALFLNGQFRPFPVRRVCSSAVEQLGLINHSSFSRAVATRKVCSSGRPCYWSAKLQGLLGDDDDNWVDEGWMPKGREGSKFRDLLENRLGMRTDVAVEHIVERIAAIAETGTIDAIADQTAPIIRHLLERWPRLDTNDRVELERLRNVAFLPGAISGQRVPQKRYPPALVYRVFRETGFNSQVPIVDLPTLRRGTSP